jgi:membrane protease YdiL (CAAX protease family)
MPDSPRVPLPALIVAMLVPMGGAFVYFVWSSGGVVTQAFFIGTKAFNWIFPLFFLGYTGLRGLGRPVPGEGGRTPVSLAKTVRFGLVFGIAVSALTLALIWWTPMGEVLRNGSGRVTEKLVALGMQENYLALALFISFGNSAMEEYYWRWFIYGNLRHHVKTGVAHGLAALAFSLHHIVVTMQFFRWDLALFLSLSVGIGGAMWSWMYQRHGTVLGAWASHIVIDLTLMWVGYELIFG